MDRPLLTKHRHCRWQLLLKGRTGDAANIVLSAAGHNFLRILAWLRELLCLFLI
jgi:hypothetical protein